MNRITSFLVSGYIVFQAVICIAGEEDDKSVLKARLERLTTLKCDFTQEYFPGKDTLAYANAHRDLALLVLNEAKADSQTVHDDLMKVANALESQKFAQFSEIYRCYFRFPSYLRIEEQSSKGGVIDYRVFNGSHWRGLVPAQFTARKNLV